jgi:hypothetical protein
VFLIFAPLRSSEGQRELDRLKRSMREFFSDGKKARSGFSQFGII